MHIMKGYLLLLDLLKYTGFRRKENTRNIMLNVSCVSMLLEVVEDYNVAENLDRYMIEYVGWWVSAGGCRCFLGM